MVRDVTLTIILVALFLTNAPVRSETSVAGEKLAKLEMDIRSGKIGNVHSVMALRNGQTVAEWYFTGQDERRGEPLGSVTFGPDQLHDVRSVTKSVVAILFGVAVRDGAIGSLETPVLDYFPEYTDLRTPEMLKIRLRDILSMTSGLTWDERNYPYTDHRNSEIAMDLAPDRYRYILSQPLSAEPGTHFTYSGGDVALVAAVISRATHKPLEAYADEKLFAPLGIRAEWLKDSAGIPYAASGLRLRPRDMGTIGQLVLQHGQWQGQTVVPKNWIDAMTEQHADVNPGDACKTQYGYLWWLGKICAPDGNRAFFLAVGNGGQTIWVVPSLDLVIVTTLGLYNEQTADAESGEIALRLMAAVDK